MDAGLFKATLPLAPCGVKSIIGNIDLLSRINSYRIDANAFEPPPRSIVRPIGPRFGHQRIPQESVMKCANPTCNHSIGLVSHRRG
jgi:hypothetical protein